MKVVLCVLVVLSTQLYGQDNALPSALTTESTKVTAHSDFRKADSIASLFPHHSLKDLRVLSNKLTNPLSTETEKFRSIYKWVCDNIANDYNLHLRNQAKRRKLIDPAKREEWNRQITKQTFKELLENQQTVCTGYSYLIKELAYHAGIRCEMIDGYGRTALANIGGTGVLNHTWNAVMLDSRWKLCDATWSSGAYDPANAVFIRNFNDGYFLCDPFAFIKNHFPADTAWMLLNKKPILEEFLNAPLVYSHAFRYGILPGDPEKFKVVLNKGDIVIFIFETITKKDVPDFDFSVNDRRLNDRAELVMQSPSPDGSRQSFYRIAHGFNRRGRFAVHVMVEGKEAVGWEIKVR